MAAIPVIIWIAMSFGIQAAFRTSITTDTGDLQRAILRYCDSIRFFIGRCVSGRFKGILPVQNQFCFGSTDFHRTVADHPHIMKDYGWGPFLDQNLLIRISNSLF